MWSFVWIKQLWQDVRFGLRMMAKNRGFTVVAAITLVLGIGGTTVVFSLLDSVLLHPLPYPQSERLYRLFPLEGKNKRGVEQASYADFLDWQRQTRTFKSLAGCHMYSLNGANGEWQVREF